MSAISVKGLSVSYERKRVLSNIFLELESGHLYGVIGPNGAGKSTLFKAILGLIPINNGQIEVLGAPAEKRRRQLAYVPQKTDIDWSFPATVLDVVLMGRYPYKKVFERLSKNDHELALGALTEVGIANLRNRQIGELSGGQQQRVFLARALCQHPEIFLLDEPFVGVDITTEERIIQILKQQASAGKTILVVHHDLATVPNYFDRVVLINQRLIAQGDTVTTFTSEMIAQTFSGQLPALHQTGLLEKG